MTSTTVENLSDAPPTKPGYLTTEFYKSLGVTVLSLLVGVGVITPDQSNKFTPWVAGIALVAAAIAAGAYSISRGKTKAAAIEAAANVLVASKHIAYDKSLRTLPAPTGEPAGFEQAPQV